MRTLKVLIGGLAFPEGPRWHDGKFVFSDMHAHQVLAVDMAGKSSVLCEVPARPSGLGWLPDGRMLVVSMTDRKLMRLDRDGLKTVADVSKLAPFDCNDMVTDSKGRSYIGIILDNYGSCSGACAPTEIDVASFQIGLPFIQCGNSWFDTSCLHNIKIGHRL